MGRERGARREASEYTLRILAKLSGSSRNSYIAEDREGVAEGRKVTSYIGRTEDCKLPTLSAVSAAAEKADCKLHTEDCRLETAHCTL